ncbi:hypothetical protein GCM10011578_024810 [Streptomyces fuscichromogenes]|uniref:Integrase n=1 Tax=Streptomyces fuscichromogenes TaxID=1324013 RepID=A0A917XAP8_9ACTN|nr:hypothetical protein GCM10011578_024810 [Streptomyces fuscichromogenes]
MVWCGPLSREADCHDWKRLLEDSGVRDARLHDARHTAATVLMLPDAMLKDVARKIAEAIWGAPETPAVDKNQDTGV